MPEFGLSSPLTLLLTEEEAEEVLLLSFTLNLAFWERFALGAARSLGARVTVVGDARYVSVDTRSVRNAGRTYLDGRALPKRGSAFHPKLLLIASEDRVVAAIGSGNATLDGWHDSAEIWTVIRGTRDRCPATIQDLVRWLVDLPSHVSFGPLVERSFRRIEELLSGFDFSEPGPSLLTSLHQPILEQIPEAWADEVVVSAPFIDPKAEAIRRVAQQLKPRRFEVVLQPPFTSFDGEALASVLDEFGGVASSITDTKRYHHGKLLEWTVGRDRFAVTGSPNASIAALGLSMAQGGNCELALLDTIPESLKPEVGESASLEQIRAISLVSTEVRVEVPSLLAVAPGPDGVLHIYLGRALNEVAELQAAQDLDVWMPLVTVPAETIDHRLDISIEPGTALRIRAADGSLSNVVFVLDPTRVQRRLVKTERHVYTDEEHVFSDPRVAEAWLNDLDQLRPHLLAERAKRSVALDKGTGERSLSSPVFESWEDYLDHCEASVGESLLAWGLGLPRLGSDSSDAETFIEEEGETADTASQQITERLPRFANYSDVQRRRYRRWCQQLVSLSPNLVPSAQLIAWRLVLVAVAGGLWTEEEEWVPLLAKATTALHSAETEFEAERYSRASATAVTSAVVHGRGVNPMTTGWLEIEFRRLTPLLADSAANVREELVERYTEGLGDVFGGAVAVEEILRLVEKLHRSNPLLDAIDALLEGGTEAYPEGQVMVLPEAGRGDPTMVSLKALALAQKGAPIGVVARGQRMTVTGVWKPPYLLLARKTPKGAPGSVFDLRGGTPRDYASVMEKVPSNLEVEAWYGRQQPPALAADLLDSVGIPPNGVQF